MLGRWFRISHWIFDATRDSGYKIDISCSCRTKLTRLRKIEQISFSVLKKNLCPHREKDQEINFHLLEHTEVAPPPQIEVLIHKETNRTLLLAHFSWKFKFLFPRGITFLSRLKEEKEFIFLQWKKRRSSPSGKRRNNTLYTLNFIWGAGGGASCAHVPPTLNSVLTDLQRKIIMPGWI